ncbi:Hsp20/alpha crystallin family protein [Paenibacillus macerans]|uniref:Hsp20/alpha crystallin family protein n=1 Tax=Paenibacillus macerans TaxID=44252 RepID=UPI0020411394|nr:Hsp20/alpha crystallin family protein [Paenibacillus macerans]MCM3702355.1 Hsp20/alpha crystallin family protein [Paenibacillus macerans]
MDMDRLKQWFEMAQQFQGKEFWDDVFREQMKPFKSSSGPSAHVSMNDSFSGMEQTGSPQSEYPPIDVLKSEQELLIVVEVPGYSKDQIEVFIEGRQLRIQGEPSMEYTGYSFIKSERHNGAFQRVIGLPGRVDTKEVTSVMDKGLLLIRFPIRAVQGRKVIID